MVKMTDESPEGKLVEKISIAFGIISIALTIYFSGNELLQIVFVAAATISFSAFYILRNSLEIRSTGETVSGIDDRLRKMEESLNIYERLLKLEREVFKNAKK